MKKFEYIISALIILMMLIVSCNMSAQEIKREGMTFKSVTNSPKGSKADTLLTAFKWEDSKGLLYPIIVNKQSGRCWIWKKSGKTGRMYKQYMKEEVSRSVCREYSITYIPKQSK